MLTEGPHPSDAKFTQCCNLTPSFPKHQDRDMRPSTHLANLTLGVSTARRKTSAAQMVMPTLHNPASAKPDSLWNHVSCPNVFHMTSMMVNPTVLMTMPCIRYNGKLMVPRYWTGLHVKIRCKHAWFEVLHISATAPQPVQ